MTGLGPRRKLASGRHALAKLTQVMAGWRLKAVAPGLIVCTHAQTPEQILAPKTIGADELARCAELGEGLAAGLSAGVF